MVNNIIIYKTRCYWSPLFPLPPANSNGSIYPLGQYTYPYGFSPPNNPIGSGERYYPVSLALKNRGVTINHRCVQRLMKLLGLKSCIRATKYRSYKGQVGKIAKNILKRKFKTKKPNQKWVSDVTQFNVQGKKLYLSPIMDLFNGEIVAYQTQRRTTYKRVDKMLK